MVEPQRKVLKVKNQGKKERYVTLRIYLEAHSVPDSGLFCSLPDRETEKEGERMEKRKCEEEKRYVMYH